MVKNDLVDLVQGQTGATKKDAAATVDAIVDRICAALKAGEDVLIAGLGAFKVVKRKARTGRNPKTGEAVDIAAKQAVKFRPAKALKELVQG